MSGEIKYQGDVGPRGPQGLPGEKGQTPIKGVDYFTEDEKKQIVEETASKITEDAEFEFNQNVTNKTNEFNDNATKKTSNFNENANEKLNEFNQNASNKEEELNVNIKPIETRLDRLESIQDTAKATGENVYFDNAKNYPLMSLKGEGRSEQVTTTGINEIEPIMKTVTANGITCTNNGDGSFTLNGTATADVNFRIDQTARLNADNLKSYKGDYVLYGAKKDVKIAVVSYPDYYDRLTVSEEGKYVKKTLDLEQAFVAVFVLKDITLNNVTIYPMLYEGTEEKPYEPYTGLQPAPNPDYPQEIKTISEASYRGCGKNLLNLVDTPATKKNGITYLAENQKIKINGTGASGSYSWLVITKNKISYSNGTPSTDRILEYSNGIISKGKVSLSKKVLNGSSTYDTMLHLYNELGKEVTTTNEDTKIVAVGIYLGGAQTHTDYTIGLQLEKGTEATEYEPYHESTLPIDLQGNELASVGTVADKLLIDRKGNVAIKKNIWKMIIDGTEEWKMQYGDSLFNFGHKTKLKKQSSKNCISNYYIYDSREASMNSMVNNTFGLQGNYKGVFFRDTRFTDIESFVAHVTSLYEAGNPIEIYYELATPELIELGTIENPEIFKGINNIVVETNLGNMQIEVEYVEDLQKRIEQIEENPSSGGGTTDYTALSNKPKINGVELSGNKTSKQLGFPSNLSEFNNDSNFISSTAVTAFWTGTQAQYDALGTYNPTTLYLINEEG